jgi:hypothetical protein
LVVSLLSSSGMASSGSVEFVRERVGIVDWLAVGEIGDAILGGGVGVLLVRRRYQYTSPLKVSQWWKDESSTMVLLRECLPVS